jgi:hypothetical protein
VSLPSGYTLPATLPVASVGEALLHRIVLTKFARKEPGFRASGRYRFDDAARGFGTLYCARDFGTCFMETLLRGRATRAVPQAAYNARSTVLLLLAADRLRLVDLYSTTALAELELDLAILAAGDYSDTQRLAALIYSHASLAHGIVYRSRFDPEQSAIALFDRAAPFVRRFPGSAPKPLTTVDELSAAVRNRVPFVLV